MPAVRNSRMISTHRRRDERPGTLKRFTMKRQTLHSLANKVMTWFIPAWIVSFCASPPSPLPTSAVEGVNTLVRLLKRKREDLLEESEEPARHKRCFESRETEPTLKNAIAFPVAKFALRVAKLGRKTALSLLPPLRGSPKFPRRAFHWHHPAQRSDPVDLVFFRKGSNADWFTQEVLDGDQRLLVCYPRNHQYRSNHNTRFLSVNDWPIPSKRLKHQFLFVRPSQGRLEVAVNDPNASTPYQYPVRPIVRPFTRLSENKDGQMMVLECFAHHPNWTHRPSPLRNEIQLPKPTLKPLQREKVKQSDVSRPLAFPPFPLPCRPLSLPCPQPQPPRREPPLTYATSCSRPAERHECVHHTPATPLSSPDLRPRSHVLPPRPRPLRRERHFRQLSPVSV